MAARAMTGVLTFESFMKNEKVSPGGKLAFLQLVLERQKGDLSFYTTPDLAKKFGVNNNTFNRLMREMESQKWCIIEWRGCRGAKVSVVECDFNFRFLKIDPEAILI